MLKDLSEAMFESIKHQKDIDEKDIDFPKKVYCGSKRGRRKKIKGSPLVTS